MPFSNGSRVCISQDDFVLDRAFREGQKECIEEIINAFEHGYQFVILEAPTGSGKSAIALTVANYFKNAFYCTAQKILQSQIMNDFSGSSNPLSIVDVRGRANYDCTYWEMNKDVLSRCMDSKHLLALINNPPDCANGHCRRTNKGKCTECFPKDGTVLCPYYERINAALQSNIVLMNYSSFLFQTAIPNRWASRDILILDEGHNLESQLLDHISISLDSVTMSYDIPDLTDAVDYYAFIESYDVLDHVSGLLRTAIEFRDIKAQDRLSGLIKRIRWFQSSIEAGDEWIHEHNVNKNSTSVTLKPLYVRYFANHSVFPMARQTLVMSATILDPRVFMDSLGIDPNSAYCYRMRNRFPVENRPIYFDPAVSVTGGKSKQKIWGPPLLKKIDEIIDCYEDVRGIVHTHNFAITNMLKEGSRHKARMLFQVDFDTKEDMLDEHANRPDSIIVAPAMHEGLDLIDDLSRFQIVCKVPYPNFIEDKQLARRMEDDYQYYNWLTALKLCQSVGRSVRHENDWADTFIIDDAFSGFRTRASSMLPGWFKEAIVEGHHESRRSNHKETSAAISEAPF